MSRVVPDARGMQALALAALGAAAALARLNPPFLRSEAPAVVWLEPLWGQVPAEQQEKDTIVDLIQEGGAA